MPGVVADYVKQEQYEKQQELEWRERETEDIPAWMDEERITAARYEEGPDLPDWEEKEHTIRIKAW